ncbi:uncharacterized protein BJX67DRAFT_276689 [Aspergillus lucknowensis]|uniref:Uncharacterized protein n=1 Tax=Aspergillus lucknowensis TaxID=176173 RepID=A0ABR4LEJ2_9EURO
MLYSVPGLWKVSLTRNSPRVKSIGCWAAKRHPEQKSAPDLFRCLSSSQSFLFLPLLILPGTSPSDLSVLFQSYLTLLSYS